MLNFAILRKQIVGCMRHPSQLFLFVWLFATLASAEEALPPFVQLLRGEASAMKLFTMRDKEFLFMSDKEERTISCSDLFKWGHPTDMKPGSYLLLNDTSLLVGAITSITSDHISFSSTKRPGMWRENHVPRDEVRAIVLQFSRLATEREIMESKWLTSVEKTDRLLFTDGDSIAGTLLSATTMKAEDSESLTLRFQPTGGAAVDIPQARVRAVVLQISAAVASPSREGFWLGMKDGSCLFARSCEVTKESVKLIRSERYAIFAQLADADLEPPPTFFDRVTLLQPISKNVVYLSDQTAIGFKHVPLLGWEAKHQMNRSVTSAGLRIGSTRYLKGIGMPATSRLAFEIPAGAKRFESEVGIDAAAEMRGSCVFRVFLETTPGTWQVAKESPVMRGGDATQPLSVEIGNAKRLALVVEMSTQGDVCDFANWLDARFVISN